MTCLCNLPGMISVEKLRSIKTLACHADCPDGLASAMILRQALPSAEVIFVQYNSIEMANLKAEPGILFCDFCPPQDRYREFLEAGAIVLDHHKSTKHIVLEFGENGVYADEKTEPGVSGAVLAFREVWNPLMEGIQSDNTVQQLYDRCVAGLIERFAQLAGIRDTWQKQSPDWEEACAQAAALMFYPKGDWLGARVDQWKSMFEIGPTLRRKQADNVTRAIKDSFRFTSAKGTRVIMFQGTSATVSDAAELLGTEADLVVAFSYMCEENEPKVIYRLRSRGSFDCSRFAKMWPPGGGHTNSAGFSLKVPSGGATNSPYEFLHELLSRYENSGE